MDKPTCVAVIPARRESKGLISKNKLPLGDKTVVEFTIESALESRLIDKDKIFVSTDDSEIAEHIALQHGVRVIDRPESCLLYTSPSPRDS